MFHVLRTHPRLLAVIVLLLCVAPATLPPSLSVAAPGDTTPPSLTYQFDPPNRDVVVFAHEEAGGSGLADVGLITPTTCIPQRGGRTCLYRATDLAGNSLTMTLQITQSSTQLRVRVLSVQAGGKPAITPLTNESVYDFAPATGPLTSLTQTVNLTDPGPPAGSQQVRATWTQSANTTTQTFIKPAAPTQTIPDLALLQTRIEASGRLAIVAGAKIDLRAAASCPPTLISNAQAVCTYSFSNAGTVPAAFDFGERTLHLVYDIDPRDGFGQNLSYELAYEAGIVGITRCTLMVDNPLVLTCIAVGDGFTMLPGSAARLPMQITFNVNGVARTVNHTFTLDPDHRIPDANPADNTVSDPFTVQP